MTERYFAYCLFCIFVHYFFFYYLCPVLLLSFCCTVELLSLKQIPRICKPGNKANSDSDYNYHYFAVFIKINKIKDFFILLLFLWQIHSLLDMVACFDNGM